MNNQNQKNEYDKTKSSGIQDITPHTINIAIVGGGRACKYFLNLIRSDPFHFLNINIVGVCDINPEAEGFVLAKKMGIFTTNDFQDLFKIKNIDSILEITGSLEKRVKELKSDFQKLIQEDRMISLGKLAASCAHEINNPIQGLLTFSHLVLEILTEGELSSEDLEQCKEHLSFMSKELERCGNIVSGLVSFSRESSLEFKDVDLNDVLHAVLKLTRHKMKLLNIDLNATFHSGPLVINGNNTRLHQCFLNVIFNSIEAMPEGGQLSIKTGLDKTNKKPRVEIRDTGYGIPKDSLSHIFDPFFTTKREGEGT